MLLFGITLCIILFNKLKGKHKLNMIGKKQLNSWIIGYVFDFILLPYSKDTDHFFDTWDITLCVEMLHI